MFFKTCKHLLLIFFLLGLNPHFTIKPSTKNRNYQGLLRFIPCCISFTFSITFLIHDFLINHDIFLLYGKINSAIAYGYVLTLVILNLSANFQCLRYRNVFLDLMKRIDRYDKVFYYFSSFNSNKLRKQLIVKCLVVFTTYSSAVIILFLNETTEATVIFKIKITLLQFGSSWITLHVIIYLEIVRTYLKAGAKFILNTSLTYDDMYNKERQLNLRSLKKMYFELWNIIQKINVCFGWSLLALLVKCFVEVLYTLYFYYLTLQRDIDATTTLRK